MRPDEALTRIDAALKELLERRREEAKQQAEAEQNRVPETEITELCDGDDTDQVDDVDEEEAELEQQELYASQQLLSQPTTSSDTQQEHDWDEADNCDASLFFESSYTPQLTKLIDRIVTLHGPISETMLYRQITRLHGWQRAGRRIQERIIACIGENECRRENGNLFIWKPNSYQERLPFRTQLNRAPRDVPQAEILGLIDEQAHTLQSSDPAKGIATLMGLGRLSADTRAYLEACIAEYERGS
jgi:ribonuclease D